VERQREGDQGGYVFFTMWEICSLWCGSWASSSGSRLSPGVQCCNQRLSLLDFSLCALTHV